MAACAEQPPPTAIVDQPAPFFSEMAAVPDPLHPAEARFSAIAAAIPEFGGYFWEGTDLVAYVTDATTSTVVENTLKPVLDGARLSGHLTATASRRIVIRQGEYTFAQLRAWRDLVSDYLLGSPAIWIDLDEGQNRVVLGLEKKDDQATAERALQDLPVPAAAVLFEVTGPVVPQGDSLRKWVRPLVGGLQIEDAVHEEPCTFGFNALWNSQEVFLTVAHCTATRWANDGTAIYQPWISGPYQIGHELYDPPSFRCGPPWDRDDCRYSDAAIIVHETDELSRGVIAATKFRAYGLGGVGSLEIDDDYPEMDITGKEAYPPGGYWIDKVGRTTGWTFGNLAKTCVTWESPSSFPGTKLLCSYWATYGSDYGDSGSPVFIFHAYEDVTLLGIHYGASVGQDTLYSIFSPIGGIEQDLGSLVVTPPTPPPAGTLNVTILGPSSVRPDTYCSWDSQVSGGNGDYSYQWLEGSSLMGTLPFVALYTGFSSLSIHLIVTSSDGWVGGDNLLVQNTPGAPICFQ